ncbi:hypothetical protein B0O99DRAFT_680002 [Bisporella sp. PMI_857]|nr:hypothetical protein B0O99DRAFT_680002 [Bisporella sp. PMI_857]
MAAFVSAAPSAEAEGAGGWVDGPAPPADYEKRSEEALNHLKARGFGCPFDKYQCDSHCRSLGGGRKGGYCGGQGFLHLTCICFK